MKEKTVFSVAVTSKHFLADIFQWIRNLLGMNLVAYEDMIRDGVEQALFKLYKSYPNVYDVKITTAMVSQGAAEIIAYGKIKVEE